MTLRIEVPSLIDDTHILNKRQNLRDTNILYIYVYMYFLKQPHVQKQTIGKQSVLLLQRSYIILIHKCSA